MNIENDRSELDAALAKEVTGVLLFVGGPGSPAELLETDMNSRSWDARHVHVQVVTDEILSEEEKEAWFGGSAGDPGDCFVFLNGSAPKSVLKNGRVSDLMYPNTTIPDYMRIRGLYLGMKFRGRGL